MGGQLKFNIIYLKYKTYGIVKYILYNYQADDWNA